MKRQKKTERMRNELAETQTDRQTDRTERESEREWVGGYVLAF
jgi:hypothetical protein